VNLIGPQGLFAGESEISVLWITDTLRVGSVTARASGQDLALNAWSTTSGHITLDNCIEVDVHRPLDLHREIKNDSANFSGRVYVNDHLEITGKIYADGGIEMLSQTTLLVGIYSDANRPTPGVAGRVIFNTTDGNLNIDDGTNWILPDGTIT